MSKSRSEQESLGTDDIAALIAEVGQKSDEQWDALDPQDRNLLNACDSGSVEDVKRLLSNGANPNAWASHGSTLTKSVRSERDSLEKVKTLLDARVDVELVEEPGCTPLTVAASNNKPEAIRLLIKSGANVNSQVGPQGWSALMTAACMGKLEAVVELAVNGSDFKLKSLDGLTAMDLARANGHNQILRFLVRALELIERKTG